MTKAIEKILNNFVFGDIDISYYDIDFHPTPELNEKVYSVEVFTPLDINVVDAEALLDKLNSALKLLGFSSVGGNIFHDADRDKLLIRSSGKIKLEEE